jgi:hypothetical protein
MKLFLIIFLIEIYTITCFSQNVITGSVIDSKDRTPIPFVNIKIKDTNIGTISNIEGNYELLIPEKYFEDTIVFSSIGYSQKEMCIQDICKNQKIELDIYITKIEGVCINAKKINPIEVLIKANKNLQLNSYNSIYNTKVYIKNFVQASNHFVSYRKTIADILVNKDDLWLGNGKIIADEQQSNKDWIINSNEDILSSLKMPPLLTYDRSFNKRILKKNTNYEIKIDTVIFSEQSKIYVIDVYKKNLNKDIKSQMYKILDKKTSPYSLFFDNNVKNIAQFFLNNSIRKIKGFSFVRYYIDAKQNYNIIKTINFSLSKLDGFKTFNYNEFEYSNIPSKSNIKHTLTFSICDDTYNSQSIFETFCFDKKYQSNLLELSNNGKLFFNYSTNIQQNISNWHENNSIKEDKFALNAIKQIKDCQNTKIVIPNNKPDLTSVSNKKLNIKLSLSGTVVDSTSLKSMEFCNVMIKDLSDSTTTGVITNENGFFNIELNLGHKYALEISFIGYKIVKDTFNLTVNNEDIKDIEDLSKIIKKDMGIIYLSPEVNMLEGVVISASNNLLDIDKQNIVVTNKMRINTVATKDILDKINGVKYNYATQEIKVDNNNNVKILVDGIDKEQSYILNLNPKRIKKIQILRNISGLYEIQGYTSIINIITYNNYRGVDFKISEQYINNIEELNENEFFSNKSNISINYTYDKFNFYIKPFYSYSKYAFDSRLITQFNNDDKIINDNIDNKPNNISKYQKVGIVGGVDYKINNKHMLGIEINTKGFPANNENINLSNDSIVLNKDTSVMNTDINSYSDYYYYKSTVYYKYNINSNSQIISYLNFDYKKIQSHQNINKIQDIYYNKTYKNLKFNVEYNQDINHIFSINIGANYINNKYLSNSINLLNNFSNNFSKIRIFSYLKIKFNSTTALFAGTSFENYSLQNTSTNYVFNAFQPKINITKKIDTNKKIIIEYHAKTEYPYLSDLSNQIYYLSSFVKYVGNSELKPYLTHNLSGQYQYQSSKFINYFSIKPYYKYSDNFIGYKGKIIDSTITYQKSNFVNYEKIGVNSDMSFSINDKISIDLAIDVFKEQNKNIDTPKIIDWTANADMSYDVSTKHNIGIIFQKDRYQTVTSLGYNELNTNSLMVYWMTLQFKGRLRCMLAYSKPFYKNQYDEIHESTDEYQKNSYHNSSFSSNFLMLNLTFILSKGNVNKVKKNINHEYFDKSTDKEFKLGL